MRLRLLLAFFLLVGCGSGDSPRLKLFRAYQGKQLDLSGLAAAPTRSADSIVPFKQIKQQYRYLSLTYLDETCDVCRFKLQEWNRHAAELPKSPALAYVILFRGDDFETFRRMSLHRDTLYSDFLVVADPEKQFLIDNATVPHELLDNTILIDSAARMLLFGEPFATSAMTELYRRVCTQ